MWDAFVAWFQSPSGQRVLDSAVIPALAILVAGVVAALIARAAVRSLLRRADRDAVAGVVAAFVEVARVLGATVPQGAERERAGRLRTEADVRLRLSGVTGAATAAEWASLRLDAIERDAASPVPQTTAAMEEVRDRLLAWVARPRRAKRLFGADVERLGAERTARREAQRPAQPTEAEAESFPDAPGKQETTVEATPAAIPAPVSPAAGPDRQAPDDRPEPVAARAQNLAHELQAERTKPTDGTTAAAAIAAGAPSLTTEPVLIQRTRLDSMDRGSVDPRFDHARHASPAEAAASAAAVSPDPPAASEVSEPEPVLEPVPAPAPVGERQPTPAWLDTYDDEAEVTRDIDLSKTPPPKAASAVRDRTRTGDDIVPRH